MIIYLTLNQPVILSGSSINFLTRTLETPDSSCTGSSVFSYRSVLGQETCKSQPRTRETQKIYEYINCLHDTTEIKLKAA